MMTDGLTDSFERVAQYVGEMEHSPLGLAVYRLATLLAEREASTDWGKGWKIGQETEDNEYADVRGDEPVFDELRSNFEEAQGRDPSARPQSPKGEQEDPASSAPDVQGPTHEELLSLYRDYVNPNGYEPQDQHDGLRAIYRLGFEAGKTQAVKQAPRLQTLWERELEAAWRAFEAAAKARVK